MPVYSLPDLPYDYAALEPAITGDLDDTKSTDAAVIAAYESSWREVLEANAWSDLLVGVVLYVLGAVGRPIGGRRHYW